MRPRKYIDPLSLALLGEGVVRKLGCPLGTVGKLLMSEVNLMEVIS
jgi:hypothetical protein